MLNVWPPKDFNLSKSSRKLTYVLIVMMSRLTLCTCSASEEEKKQRFDFLKLYTGTWISAFKDESDNTWFNTTNFITLLSMIAVTEIHLPWMLFDWFWQYEICQKEKTSVKTSVLIITTWREAILIIICRLVW